MAWKGCDKNIFYEFAIAKQRLSEFMQMLKKLHDSVCLVSHIFVNHFWQWRWNMAVCMLVGDWSVKAAQKWKKHCDWSPYYRPTTYPFRRYPIRARLQFVANLERALYRQLYEANDIIKTGQQINNYSYRKANMFLQLPWRLEPIAYLIKLV